MSLSASIQTPVHHATDQEITSPSHNKSACQQPACLPAACQVDSQPWHESLQLTTHVYTQTIMVDQFIDRSVA